MTLFINAVFDKANFFFTKLQYINLFLMDSALVLYKGTIDLTQGHKDFFQISPKIFIVLKFKFRF